jgi:nucleoid DNA-binding protein
MSKSEMIEKIAAEHSELSKKQVKGVIESLATVGYKELKKNGAFVVPGFAKFVVIKKPATKERKGHQSVHKRAHGVQGETRSKDHQGTPGEGSERRRVSKVFCTFREGSRERGGWPWLRRSPADGTKCWRTAPTPSSRIDGSIESRSRKDSPQHLLAFQQTLAR